MTGPPPSLLVRLDRALHRVHGTRGLLWASLVLLLASLLEPALPDALSRFWIALPAFALLVTALATLPREGVGAQDRARALLDHPDPGRPMLRRLAWLALLNVALLPRIFLGAYGIPHMSPLTGLLLPTMQLRIALVFLFLVLLLPILYLRSSRRYAPDIRNPMATEEKGRRLEAMALATLGIIVTWAVLLRPFWQPFTLLELPPSLGSLHDGARGVAAVTFAIVPPAVLFVSLVAHVDLLARVRIRREHPQRTTLAWLGSLHVGLILLATVQHAYVLLWIARYETAFGV